MNVMANLTEYGLVAALVAGMSVYGAGKVGGSVNATFCSVGNSLGAVSGKAPSTCGHPAGNAAPNHAAPVTKISTGKQATAPAETFTGTATGSETIAGSPDVTMPLSGSFSLSISGSTVSLTISRLSANGKPLAQVAPGIYPNSITYTGGFLADGSFRGTASPADGNCGNFRCTATATFSNGTVTGTFGASFNVGVGPFDHFSGTFNGTM